MAFIIKDRVKEATTSTGTGAVSLGGAAATFDTFQSYMTNGDTTYYAIVHTTSGTDEWEVGLGTWNTGNTLTRTTVLAGSNGTSAVNFSAGTKDVFMTYPAAHAALAGDDVNFANITVTGTVDGRDVAADGTKLDTVETNADVTDTVNVAAAGALMKSGGTMTGNLILNADPTAALGAATKEYVDTIASAGIHYHDPVRVETPSALTSTYNNGSSGVGATLTNNGTQTALVIDGVTMALNDRVLVYNQTNEAHNGIYTVTNVGSASTNWVLTRATDADSYGASDPNSFGKGDAFFVKEGNTGAGELYVMTTAGTITFGTTAIHFSQVAETAVYNAGTGLTLTGTTFSIGQDVGTTANVTFNQVTAAIIGNVTGNLTGDVTGNADTATALETARTIQLSGDVTGSATFDGSANINITAAVQDDSHAHVISNVDGLQTALDGKVPTTRTITAGNGLTGGGDLSANRTLTVGGGTGVTVNANDIAIGQDVATTASPTFAGMTTTGNINHGDNVKAQFGASNDLQIYHDGSRSLISDQGFGNLVIRAGDFTVQNPDGTETFIQATRNGSVDLFYDQGTYTTPKLQTTSTGVSVTGNATFADNGKAIFGASADLQIYHDGSNSWLRNFGTGSLYVAGDADGDVIIQGKAGQNSVACFDDGAVQLYHSGSLKLATTSTGINVSGTITADSTFFLEASSGFANMELGGPSGAYIDLKSPNTDDYDGRLQYDGSNLILATNSDQGIALKHNNATKLLTNSTGIDVTGNITVSGTVDGRDISGITATNAELNILDGVTATTTELNYVDGVTSNIQTQLNAKADDATTISAGGGLTGGGSLGANRTISHADTSSQASVNNSNGTVIQDITLDTYGHITGLASVNLDGRYYTETEADSRFLRANADDSFSGNLTSADNGWIKFYASEETDSNDGKIGSGLFSSGLNIVGAQTVAGTGRQVRIWGNLLTSGGNVYFNDGYHPNADKWTTARTLSLSGDASGSVSWDGSANATLSVTVANDSHNHNHSDGDFTVNGHLSNSGGAKLEVMNGTDGGTSKGIYMWSTGDTNWVQYMSQSGSGKAPDGGTAPLPISGGTSHQIRFRAHNTSNHGFIFENSGDQTLMNLRGNDGNMYVRGNIYANNSTSNRVFAENYHPNADKWTTSRTLSLSGDASGSVSWDGSANATLSVTVANDSHTHDGRYFTESEADGRFLRKSAAGDATGRITFKANDTNNWDSIANGTGSLGAIEIFNNGAGNDAFMTFHVGGDFACYFGLDGGINDLAVGGWSMGANSYRIWHQGNDGSGSGLDADLLDGQQGSYYYSPSNEPTASARNGYFWENNQTITSNQTITNGKNAMSAGPITINSGVTVTVGTGEAWTVV